MTIDNPLSQKEIDDKLLNFKEYPVNIVKNYNYNPISDIPLPKKEMDDKMSTLTKEIDIPVLNYNTIDSDLENPLSQIEIDNKMLKFQNIYHPEYTSMKSTLDIIKHRNFITWWKNNRNLLSFVEYDKLHREKHEIVGENMTPEEYRKSRELFSHYIPYKYDYYADHDLLYNSDRLQKK
jgi:hypothetical protein